VESGEVVHGSFDEGWNRASGGLELMVCPSAEAMEEAANDGHNGSCIHWLFVDFSQEVELRKGNFTFVVVEAVCMFEVGELMFWDHFFVLA